MAGQPEQGQAKKLTDAAEHWASGGVKDETPDDAAVLGVLLPDEASAADEFQVWPENWETIVMWCRVQTQWRTSSGGAVGLDYSVLAWLFKMYAVEDPRALLEDLQVMESAALTAMHKEG